MKKVSCEAADANKKEFLGKFLCLLFLLSDVSIASFIMPSFLVQKYRIVTARVKTICFGREYSTVMFEQLFSDNEK